MKLLVVIGGACLLSVLGAILAMGCTAGDWCPDLRAAGSLGLFVAVLPGLGLLRRNARAESAEKVDETGALEETQASDDPNKSQESGLVDELLGQSRYALLLRAQIVGNLSSEQVDEASNKLDQAMALVPEGEVVLPCGEVPPNSDIVPDESVFVDAFFLDRHAVTNAEFKLFVDADGYEQISFWDQEVPGRHARFRRSNRIPGAEFWREGTYLPGQAKHPVVGVNWYEAQAYARWAGKRLLTDAEWVKAGSWPVLSGQEKLFQRPYPWGESMDRSLANLWGGPGTTVDVDAYAKGASVNGVYQLIGNVWEWMSCDFGEWDANARQLRLNEPMKGLRGGAFDTYFDNQATCFFQSGDSIMARKHNIGFRCAVGLGDVPGIDLMSALDSEDEEFGQ